MKLGIAAWKKKAGPGTTPPAAAVPAGNDLPAPAATDSDPAAAPVPDGARLADDLSAADEAWEKMPPVMARELPVRGDSVVIDDPNTEPGGLYIHERVLASELTPVHIATPERPADLRIEALEKAAQAARLLVCDVQECHDHAEPLVAHVLGPIIRETSRIAVELQSVLTALKKTT